MTCAQKYAMQRSGAPTFVRPFGGKGGNQSSWRSQECTRNRRVPQSEPGTANVEQTNDDKAGSSGLELHHQQTKRFLRTGKTPVLRVVRWLFRLRGDGLRQERGRRPNETIQCQQSARQGDLLAGLAGPGPGLNPDQPDGRKRRPSAAVFIFPTLIGGLRARGGRLPHCRPLVQRALA